MFSYYLNVNLVLIERALVDLFKTLILSEVCSLIHSSYTITFHFKGES